MYAMIAIAIMVGLSSLIILGSPVSANGMQHSAIIAQAKEPSVQSVFNDSGQSVDPEPSFSAGA